MSLSKAALEELKQSTLLPSTNVKLQKKSRVWRDTNDIHLPISKYKPENNDDIKNNTNDAVQSLTIVHISDTHNKHQRMRRCIPDGDVLIHSGDFVSRCFWNSVQDQNAKDIHNIPNPIYEFNEWIGRMPHKYKIVIAGNHECCFNELSKDIISNKILTNCIYLQDEFVEIHGLKIYGTPWTACGDRWGFGTNGFNNTLYSKWNAIPNDTDILVTHMAPYGIFDLAWQRTDGPLSPCPVPECKGKRHSNHAHWGCYNLLCQVQNRIRPYLHLYGHVHDQIGFRYDKQCNVLFVNSAMDIMNKCHRTKVVFDLKDSDAKKKESASLSSISNLKQLWHLSEAPPIN
eukprot:1133388_1